MNKVPNPNLKLNYVRGVAMIIIQEVVAQLKGNNVKSVTKKIILQKCVGVRKTKKYMEQIKMNIVTLTRMTVILCTLYKDKDKSDSWCENITVGNTSIKFQLDTSAEILANNY